MAVCWVGQGVWPLAQLLLTQLLLIQRGVSNLLCGLAMCQPRYRSVNSKGGLRFADASDHCLLARHLLVTRPLISDSHATLALCLPAHLINVSLESLSGYQNGF